MTSNLEPPGSRHASSAPFSEERREGLRDLLTVYDRHFESVELKTLEWARSHRELGPLFRRSPEGLEGGTQSARARLRTVMSGDWTGFAEHLRQHGTILADAGVGFHASCAWARAFGRQLLPLVIESYGSDPARLSVAVQTLNDLADHSAMLIADAYFARKDESIRAREQDLATTLDSIGDGVIVTDAQGRVTRINPVAERLTGYSLAECLDRPLEEVFRIESEDSGMPVASPSARVLREGVVVGLANHTALIARDGTRRAIADSGAPIRGENGAIRGVVLVFRDVTEERRAEEQLRHWERIFQHATWGVGVVSASELRFQAVNTAYAEMHGYTVNELVGDHVSKLWAPETRADMNRHTDATASHGRLIVETTHLRKDGSRLPVEVVGTVIKDSQNNPIWFVANVQDITERKRLQQSQIRAIELEAENRRIEEANRLKNEFLANMSHELRTPLNSIIGFAELLHDEQVGSIEPQQKEFLQEILKGGVHLLRLINDVLDLSKVEAGKMDFRPEPVDLAALTRSVVQSLSASAAERRLKLDVSVDPTLIEVVLDPGRFTQLLYNYLSNALKFTPEGGSVLVRIRAEGTLDFRLEVEDTGPGIAREEMARLFVPFQQLDSSTTKRFGGTGLGLALTKRLAEAQGGSVGVRPAASGGSIFFAVLPCHPTTSSDMERRADVPVASTVLVVENDPKDQEVMVRILEDAGYSVTAVATAADAVSAWHQRAYDAMALSLLLPDSSDIRALLEHVRREKGRQNVPVIALASAADHDTTPSFAVTEVLTKPIDAHALLSALEQGGAPPARGTPVLIVDDDPGSLKLMEATLTKLGYDALCFSNAPDALTALERVRPAAIVLDLLMPSMDGFAFLERLRTLPEHARTPVMIWTVKDLSTAERQHLHDVAQAIVQKGAGDDFPLSSLLRTFLPTHQALRRKP
jgi:PAS domain S-box-containing protein